MKSRDRSLPRYALSRDDAAASLGMSLTHFKENVQPFVPCIRSGQLVLFRPEVLDRWARENETIRGRAA